MDMTGWLEYFVEGLATQLQEVGERGKKAIRADLLAKEHGLNDRQGKILRLIIDQDGIAIGDVEKACPGVNRRTLQRDLRGLTEKGLLYTEGATNRLIYRFKNRYLGNN